MSSCSSEVKRLRRDPLAQWKRMMENNIECLESSRKIYTEGNGYGSAKCRRAYLRGNVDCLQRLLDDTRHPNMENRHICNLSEKLDSCESVKQEDTHCRITRHNVPNQNYNIIADTEDSKKITVDNQKGIKLDNSETVALCAQPLTLCSIKSVCGEDIQQSLYSHNIRNTVCHDIELETDLKDRQNFLNKSKTIYPTDTIIDAYYPHSCNDDFVCETPFYPKHVGNIESDGANTYTQNTDCMGSHECAAFSEGARMFTVDKHKEVDGICKHGKFLPSKQNTIKSTKTGCKTHHYFQSGIYIDNGQNILSTGKDGKTYDNCLLNIGDVDNKQSMCNTDTNHQSYNIACEGEITLKTGTDCTTNNNLANAQSYLSVCKDCRTNNNVKNYKANNNIEDCKTNNSVEDCKTNNSVEDCKTNNSVEDCKTNNKDEDCKTDHNVEDCKTDNNVEDCKTSNKVEDCKTNNNVEDCKTDNNVEDCKTDNNVEDYKTDNNVEDCKTDNIVEDCKTNNNVDNAYSPVSAWKDCKTQNARYVNNGQSILNGNKAGIQESRKDEKLDVRRCLMTTDQNRFDFNMDSSANFKNAYDNQNITNKLEYAITSSERIRSDERKILEIPQTCTNVDVDLCSEDIDGSTTDDLLDINGIKEHVNISSKEISNMTSKVDCLQDTVKHTKFTIACRLSSCDITTSAILYDKINPVEERGGTLIPCILKSEFTNTANKTHKNKCVTNPDSVYDNTSLTNSLHKTDADNSVINCCSGSSLIKKSVGVSRSMCTLILSNVPHKSNRQKRACRSSSLENIVQHDMKKSQTCQINSVNHVVKNRIAYTNILCSKDEHISSVCREVVLSDHLTAEYTQNCKLLKQKSSEKISQNFNLSPASNKKQILLDHEQKSDKTLKHLTRNPMTQWTRLVNDNIEAVFKIQSDPQYRFKNFEASNLNKTEHPHRSQNVNTEKIKSGRAEFANAQIKSQKHCFKNNYSSESSGINSNEKMLQMYGLYDSVTSFEQKDSTDCHETDSTCFSVKCHEMEAKSLSTNILEKSRLEISEPFGTDDQHCYSKNLANIGCSYSNDCKQSYHEKENNDVYDKKDDKIMLDEKYGNVCENHETAAKQDVDMVTTLSSSQCNNNDTAVVLIHNSVHETESIEANKNILKKHTIFLEEGKEDNKNVRVCNKHEQYSEDKCVQIEECVKCGFRHNVKVEGDCRDKDIYSLDCHHDNRTEMIVDEGRVQNMQTSKMEDCEDLTEFGGRDSGVYQTPFGSGDCAVDCTEFVGVDSEGYMTHFGDRDCVVDWTKLGGGDCEKDRTHFLRRYCEVDWTKFGGGDCEVDWTKFGGGDCEVDGIEFGGRDSRADQTQFAEGDCKADKKKLVEDNWEYLQTNQCLNIENNNSECYDFSIILRQDDCSSEKENEVVDSVDGYGRKNYNGRECNISKFIHSEMSEIQCTDKERNSLVMIDSDNYDRTEVSKDEAIAQNITTSEIINVSESSSTTVASQNDSTKGKASYKNTSYDKCMTNCVMEASEKVKTNECETNIFPGVTFREFDCHDDEIDVDIAADTIGIHGAKEYTHSPEKNQFMRQCSDVCQQDKTINTRDKIEDTQIFSCGIPAYENLLDRNSCKLATNSSVLDVSGSTKTYSNFSNVEELIVTCTQHSVRVALLHGNAALCEKTDETTNSLVQSVSSIIETSSNFSNEEENIVTYTHHSGSVATLYDDNIMDERTDKTKEYKPVIELSCGNSLYKNAAFVNRNPRVLSLLDLQHSTRRDNELCESTSADNLATRNACRLHVLCVWTVKPHTVRSKSDTEFRSATNRKCMTENGSATNGFFDTEGVSVNKRKSGTQIRLANNGKSDTGIGKVNSNKSDTEIESASNEMSDNEISYGNSEKCGAQIRYINSMKSETEIACADNEIYDIEIRSVNNGKSYTENRSTNNDKSDTEIRIANNDKSYTQIRSVNNRKCNTEISFANNRKCDADIRDVNNGKCDTDIRDVNNRKCDANIRDVNNRKCDADIRDVNNRKCDTDIRDINNRKCDADIRDVNNGKCDADIRDVNNRKCDADIRDVNNGKCDTGIRDVNNGKCDTDIRDVNNGKCDADIRDVNNGKCYDDIRDVNGKCDTDIRDVNNRKCDADITYDSGKTQAEINCSKKGKSSVRIQCAKDEQCPKPIVECLGHVRKDRYDEKDNHGVLQFDEKAATEITQLNTSKIKEVEADRIEDSKRTVKHLTRNPVAQWNRLVNANIEAVARKKADTTDAKWYGSSTYEPCRLGKRGSLKTSQHVSKENIQSESLDISTVQFKHGGYCFEPVHMKECSELLNTNICSFPTIIGSLNSQEYNTACLKTVSDAVIDTNSDNNIDAKYKNWNMTVSQKIKPEKLEVAERAKWQWYSTNLCGTGCSCNQDCTESHHPESGMNTTYAQQEVKETVDENCGHVVSENMTVNKVPVSVSQYKNISGGTRFSTKPVCETVYVGTTKDTRQEDNKKPFRKKCTIYSEDSSIGNVRGKQCDPFNGMSKNELKGDEVCSQDFTNRRISDVSESVKINGQASMCDFRDSTDGCGIVCNDKYGANQIKYILTSNETNHTKQHVTVQVLQKDINDCELNSSSKNSDFEMKCMPSKTEVTKLVSVCSDKEINIEGEENFYKDKVIIATCKSETQVLSDDVTIYLEEDFHKEKVVNATCKSETHVLSNDDSAISHEENQTMKTSTKTVMPFFIISIASANKGCDNKNIVNYTQQSCNNVSILDGIGTKYKYIDKRENHSNIDVHCKNAFLKKNSFRISRSDHTLLLPTFSRSFFKENRLYRSTSADNFITNDKYKTGRCLLKVTKYKKLNRMSNRGMRGALTGSSIDKLKPELSEDGCRPGCIEDDKTTSLQGLQKTTANVNQLHSLNSKDSEGKNFMVLPQESLSEGKNCIAEKSLPEGKNPMVQIEKSLSEGVNNMVNTEKTLFEGGNNMMHTEKSLSEGDNNMMHTEKSLFEGDNNMKHTEKSLFEGDNSMKHTEKSLSEGDNNMVHTEKSLFEGDNNMVNTEKSLFEEGNNMMHTEKSLFEEDNNIMHTEKSLSERKNSVLNTEQPLPEGRNFIVHTDESYKPLKHLTRNHGTRTLKQLTRNPMTQWTRLVNNNIEAVSKRKVGESELAKCGGGDFEADIFGKSKSYIFPERVLGTIFNESESAESALEKLYSSEPESAKSGTEMYSSEPESAKSSTVKLNLRKPESAKIETVKLYLNESQSAKSGTEKYLSEPESDNSGTEKCYLNELESANNKTELYLSEPESAKSWTEKYLNESESAKSCTEKHLNESESAKNGTEKHLRKSESAKNGTEKHLNESESAKSGTEKHLNETDTAKSGTEKHLNGSESAKSGTEKHLNETDATKSGTEKHLNESESAKRGTEKHLNKSESAKRDTEKHLNESESAKRDTEKVYLSESESAKGATNKLYLSESEPTKHNTEKLYLSESESARSVTDKLFLSSNDISSFEEVGVVPRIPNPCAHCMGETPEEKVKSLSSDACLCEQTKVVQLLHLIDDEHLLACKTVSHLNRTIDVNQAETEIRAPMLDKTQVSKFDSVPLCEVKAAVNPRTDCVHYVTCQSDNSATDSSLWPIFSEKTDAKLQRISVSQQQMQPQFILNQLNSVNVARPLWRSKRPLKTLDVTIYVHKSKGYDKLSSKNKIIDCDEVCNRSKMKNQENNSSTDKSKNQDKIFTRDRHKYSSTDERKLQDTFSNTVKRKYRENIFRTDKSNKIAGLHSSKEKDIVCNKDSNVLKLGIAAQISENYDRISCNLSTRQAQCSATTQDRAIELLDELSCEDTSSNSGWSRFWYFITHMFTGFSKPLLPHQNNVENQELMITKNEQMGQKLKNSDHKQKVHCFKGKWGQKYNESGVSLFNIHSPHNKKHMLENRICIRNDSDSKKHRKQNVITGIDLNTGEGSLGVTEYDKMTARSKVKLSQEKKSSSDTDWREPTENILFRDQVEGPCVETDYLSEGKNIEKCSYVLVPQNHSNSYTQIGKNHDKSESQTVSSDNTNTFTDSKEFSGVGKCKPGLHKSQIPVFVSRYYKSIMSDLDNERITRRCQQKKADSLENKEQTENETTVKHHNLLETEIFELMKENKESEQNYVSACQTTTALGKEFSLYHDTSERESTLHEMGAAKTDGTLPVRKSASIRKDTSNIIQFLDTSARIRDKFSINNAQSMSVIGNTESEQEHLGLCQNFEDTTCNIFMDDSEDKTAIFDKCYQCENKSEDDATLHEIGVVETDSKYSMLPVRKSASIKEDANNIIHFLDTPARNKEKVSFNTESISDDEDLGDYFQNLETLNQKVADIRPDLRQHGQGCSRDECCDLTESQLLQSSLECLLEMLLQRGKVTHAFITNIEGEVLAKTARCSVTAQDISNILFSLFSSYRGMVKITVFNDVHTCFKHDENSLVGRASNDIFVARRGHQSIVVGFCDALTPGSCVKEVQELSELLNKRGL